MLPPIVGPQIPLLDVIARKWTAKIRSKNWDDIAVTAVLQLIELLVPKYMLNYITNSLRGRRGAVSPARRAIVEAAELLQTLVYDQQD